MKLTSKAPVTRAQSETDQRQPGNHRPPGKNAYSSTDWKTVVGGCGKLLAGGEISALQNLVAGRLLWSSEVLEGANLLYAWWFWQ